MVASGLSLDEQDLEKQRLAEDRKASIVARAEQLGMNLPELTGFEDESTKSLIQANRYLRRGKIPTLKPLLPLLLRLKGQPYKLHNYFPFEPFFRTRMSRMTLLKTGRQVSKCFDENTPVLMADGTRKPAKLLKVGDIVMSRNIHGVLVPRAITKIWETSTKDVVRVTTVSGKFVRVSKDHRLLVQDRDNHTEDYVEAGRIMHGDYVQVLNPSGRLEWDRVQSVVPDGIAKMLDIEVEEEHNFVLDQIVSHNSTSLAAQGVVFSNSIPYFSTLYVTPLFEMIRRFSHQYVRAFIEESPAKRLFMGKRCVNQVLQRSFRNGASMYFSYAFMDAERTRGIPADKNVIDEIQDMQHDFLQIIHETLSGSPWGIIQYAGTPKSLENTMEVLWQDTSQAEWMIKCQTAGCGHWNVPAHSHDLLDMIGPHHSDISETNPGVVCAKCVTPTGKRNPLNPRLGRWVHAYPERRWTFAGYHVPQIIMPMHYGNHEKWERLVGKMQGRGNTSFTTFLNEVCGESCDEGSKLITLSDLKEAATLPWKNDWREAVRHIRGYQRRILAVDWGGGGGRVGTAKKDKEKRARTSFTSLAVLGFCADGKIDVIWGHRSLKTHDFEYEARLCVEAIERFKCSHIVHDYGGAGSGREVIIRQAGMPYHSIIPVKYHGSASANIMNHMPATEDHPRDWYSVDKSRSLVTTCQCIKYKLIRMFQYDYINQDQQGLMHDFLSLIEEKTENVMGTDMYKISKNPNLSDDWAQAVNIGCCALWYMHKAWPNIAEAAKFKIPAHILSHINPVGKINWDEF